MEKFNEYFSIPIAIISAIAGIVSITKDSEWYVYIPCFIVTAILPIIFFAKKASLHDFKILWQEITFEITDVEGRLVKYKNESMLKSCKAKSQEFDYSLCSDGEIVNICLTPGVIYEQKIEAGEIYIRTHTPTIVNNGEQIKQVLTCEMKNSFTNNREYWETTRISFGSNIRYVFIFPTSRPFIECKAYKLFGRRKVFANTQPFATTVDKKPAFIFAIKQVKVSDIYRIEWSW